MPLAKGSLIYSNFTAKVKDTGEGIDSTLEGEAKELNIYDATRKYEPRLVAVGESWLISGLDDEVAKMAVGEKKQIELPPEKAYGLRDPTQVRMIPLRKFGEKQHELEVGDSIELDNRVGVVRFIGSGRAQVDFNHRLAGKSILYDFEVVSSVETDADKLRALIDRRFAGEGGKVQFSFEGTVVKVEIPDELFLLEGLQIIKRGLSADVFKFVPQVGDLTFSEKFTNKNPVAKKEEAKTTAVAEVGAAKEAAPKTRQRKKVAAIQKSP